MRLWILFAGQGWDGDGTGMGRGWDWDGTGTGWGQGPDGTGTHRDYIDNLSLGFGFGFSLGSALAEVCQLQNILKSFPNVFSY